MIMIEYYWVPENRLISIDTKPLKVWTVLPSHGGLDKNVIPDIETPLHNVNVFIEDYMHDWLWSNGKLKYSSRIIESGVWIRVELKT